MARKAADTVLSAQVIVRAASGKRLGAEPITSRNVAEYAPSPDDTAAVQTAFRTAAFQTGNLVGISFSITAPQSTFEKFFRVKFQRKPDGSYGVGPSGELEIPLNALPRELRERIVAVTFTPPADLHGKKRGSALM